MLSPDPSFFDQPELVESSVYDTVCQRGSEASMRSGEGTDLKPIFEFLLGHVDIFVELPGRKTSVKDERIIYNLKLLV